MKFTISASIFIAIIIILLNTLAFARPKVKIVASITPLAGIIAMLARDQAFVTTIANNSDCPHHYNLKPSDLAKVKGADMVFHIDEQFDGFVSKLMNNHSNNTVKISNFTGLRIIGNNWHIWLDLGNVKILLGELAQILAKRFPDISSDIYGNLEEATKQIEMLMKIKNTKLASLTDAILLSDSLEYFFDNSQTNIVKLYGSEQRSIKHLNHVTDLLNRSNSRCLLLSTTQNGAIYQKLKAKTIEVESENWQVVNISNDLFYQQYLKMINQVAGCLNY